MGRGFVALHHTTVFYVHGLCFLTLPASAACQVKEFPTVAEPWSPSVSKGMEMVMGTLSKVCDVHIDSLKTNTTTSTEKAGLMQDLSKFVSGTDNFGPKHQTQVNPWLTSEAGRSLAPWMSCRLEFDRFCDRTFDASSSLFQYVDKSSEVEDRRLTFRRPSFPAVVSLY